MWEGEEDMVTGKYADAVLHILWLVYVQAVHA